MKKVFLILIAVVLILFYFTQLGADNEAYKEEIEAYWEDRHDFFRTSSASPFVQKGVTYQNAAVYPPDPSYRVTASLDRFSTREVIQLTNSDGTSTSYLKFARATFKIKGFEQSLLILKALGFGNQYLLAFGDETSGDTTYGGGRYLDIGVGKSDQVILDFNKAYNPYCAYFDDFTCPLPSRENLLTVAIEAGEKNYPYYPE